VWDYFREHKGAILFIVLMTFFRGAIADWNHVPTGSMKPTIVEGDHILINRLAYDIKLPLTAVSVWRLADPERGDIVVFDSEAAGMRMVKRVIGLPGDSVAMRNNRIYINHRQLPRKSVAQCSSHDEGYEAYREELGSTSYCLQLSGEIHRFGSFGPAVVPADHYLVLGDNRDNSADSRVHGFIPRKEIIGRTLRVAWSLDRGRFYRPRFQRFFSGLDPVAPQ